MEVVAENHSRAIGRDCKVQLKKEKSKNACKEVKTLMGIPTETAYVS